MQTRLKKIGSSRGFTLPIALLEKLGWSEQTGLEISLTEQGLLITKVAPTLSEILASVPTEGLNESELDWGQDVGLENEG